MITIHQERPDTPDARALIAELEAFLNPLYPPESRHGLSVEALLTQGVDFFIIRDHEQAAGCVGLLSVGHEYGEVKRMYVRPAFRGRGLGARLLDHLVEQARTRGLPCLRLEMGVTQPEAQRLYERQGFYQVGPFGPYRPDPLCLFYERRIE